MNRESQVIVDPGAYLNIINTKKAVFKGAPDNYDVKSRVYYDPSVSTDTDDLNVKSSILNFVADGLKFDEQVVKSKAAYALPYNKKYLDEIFQNKNVISDDYKIEIGKYKKRNEQTIKLIQKMKENNEKRLALVDEIKPEKRSQVKFKPINFFVETKKISISDGNLKSDDSKKFSESILTKSSDNFDLIENVFLTEIEHKETPINQNTENKILLEDNIKPIDKYDWDEYLIDSLSEHTARWIVYKKVTNPKQKQKLLNLIESKYGRYTRNPDEIELVEDSLSEFEKQKIKEEKDRLKAEKMLKENPSQASVGLDKSDDRNEEKIPLYRLPHGLKQIELEKTKRPDPNYNTTAKNLYIEPSRVLSPKNYAKRMEDKNVTEKSLLKIEDSYTNEMLAGNDKQIFTKDKEKIYLENGKTFTKSYQTVYPEEFTVWLNGAEIEAKVNEEKNKKPAKGMKKWKKYPELIDNYKMNKPVELNDNTNFWHLLPSVTPDTELRKILKSNFTVAKILDEWRHRWETSNKWTLAEVEQLINDMKSDQANIRFQAVVICSRAIERMQLLIDKLAAYNKKYPMKKFKSEDLHEEFKMLYKQRSELSFGKKNLMIKSASNQRPKKFLNDIMFSEKLFETVETLLYDANSKVKLAAATSIFIILKKFSRPYIEKYQMTKNKAEYVLRDALKAFSSVDRFTAALTLGNDGYADVTIINILLSNYYNSNEQYTKEQVTQCLSDLSSHNQIISRKMEEYLKSEHVRERILTCKLIPCLRGPLSKKTVTKLIELMWNDINHNVKKVAAQTLGRTGRGREVHDEIFKRLHSRNIFDRMSALKVINYIGIMTPKLLEIYLKCFRDDCLSVRQLACLACQRLYEKDEKIVDALVFMARFDPASKLKALSIRTLGLIGSYKSDIRSALMWALQFEMDPIIRTEACHSIILLNNQKDQELIDILLERHLVEEESIVRKEIMDALIHLGYDPNRELPIVTKIKEDIKNLNDKNVIISKILEIEKKHDFEFEKKRLIWDENDDNDGLKKDSCRDAKSESSYESFGPFEPKLIEKSKKYNSKFFRKAKNSKNSNFLSKLVQIDNRELTLSLSSLNFDSNSFEEYANDHEYKKSLNDTNLSSQRIKTIVEERD